MRISLRGLWPCRPATGKRALNDRKPMKRSTEQDDSQVDMARYIDYRPRREMLDAVGHCLRGVFPAEETSFSDLLAKLNARS